MSQEYHYFSLAEVGRLLKQREISPVELVQATLDRIEDVDGRTKAYVLLFQAEALALARSAEKDIRHGQYGGPLHGIPIAIKDLYDVAGGVTASGSKVRSSYVPKSDATVVHKLRDAGAIVIGKVATHEFALGFDAPPARNPWNLNCTPCGSSGGSGSALAAGLCFGATGSDTGGSIRAPAAVNGVAGIKPTYGRVSKHGVASLSWSLDHAGPMARTTEDLALMLRVIAGYDAEDPTTRDVEVPDYAAALSGDLRGIRVGLPQNYFFEDLQPSVSAAVTPAIAMLEQLGAKVVELTIEHLSNVLATFVSIVTPEAATYHQRTFAKRAEEYGPDVRELLEVGSLCLATTYIGAQRNRSVINASLTAALKTVDVIVTPTLPVTAPQVGQKTYRWKDREESIFAACARFLCPFNLSGLPASSVRCGFSEDRMPIGLQIVGQPFDEATVLKVADAFERASEWRDMHPELT